MNDSLHCTERWSHSIYYPAAFLNISKYFNETFTNIFLQQEIFHQSVLSSPASGPGSGRVGPHIVRVWGRGGDLHPPVDLREGEGDTRQGRRQWG